MPTRRLRKQVRLMLAAIVLTASAADGAKADDGHGTQGVVAGEGRPSIIGRLTTTHDHICGV